MGKPYTLREDAVLRHCLQDSWLRNRFSQATDLPIQAYAVMQQIMSRALDTLHASTRGPTGLLVDCDYPLVLHSIQEQLDEWFDGWGHGGQWVSAVVVSDIPATNHANDDPQLSRHDTTAERRALADAYNATARFFYNYNSLVINSFGLQNALENLPTDLPYYFVRVYQAACGVLDITSNVYAMDGTLPYLTDGMFVMLSYAVLSLLKVSPSPGLSLLSCISKLPVFGMLLTSSPPFPPLYSLFDPSLKTSIKIVRGSSLKSVELPSYSPTPPRTLTTLPLSTPFYSRA